MYRARKLLVSASEKINHAGRSRLRGLLDAGDSRGEVREAWHAEETVRGIYEIPDHKTAVETVEQLAGDLQDPGFPRELNRLGRTLERWQTQISNQHAARVTNAPTEAANNPIKPGPNAPLLPNTSTAVRRQTRLVTTGHPHPSLTHERTPEDRPPRHPLRPSRPTSNTIPL